LNSVLIRTARRLSAAPLALVLPTAFALLLGACSSMPKIVFTPPPPPPAHLLTSVAATAQINPDTRQRASPLLVRVYELKADTAFNNADFMSLYQADSATLAADVVHREEFILQPGEKRSFDRLLDDKVRFVGVLAAYRNIEKARWRAIAAVPAASASQQVKVDVDALAVAVSVAAAPPAAK
jgi:type VI secretion system protein VasD